MKTLKKQTLAVLAVIFITMVGCTNKKDASISPGNTANLITQGNWKVSNFSSSGKDETQKFVGFTFAFESNGTLMVTSGSNAQTGSWSTGMDDSRIKLYLSLGNISPFDDLSNDWHIIKQNASTIELEDVSGGNGSTDYLTFIKN